MSDKEIVELALRECSRDFYALLMFFYYEKKNYLVRFIHNKIDKIVRHKSFLSFLEHIKKTSFGDYAFAIKSMLRFSFFKKSFLGEGWYVRIFQCLHKIARNVKSVTDMLDDYVIRYIVIKTNDKSKILPYTKQISNLFRDYYKEFSLSRKAIKKKSFKKHPFANYFYLRKRIKEKSSRCVLAIHKDKVVGFGLGSLLELGVRWKNIAECGNLIVDPRYRGFGIAENLNLYGYDIMKDTTYADYFVVFATTLHPITIHIVERTGYKPLFFELGGYEDYQGYTEPGFGNSDYSNYLTMFCDLRGYIRSSIDIVFVYYKDYEMIKLIYKILGCKRFIVKYKNPSPVIDSSLKSKVKEIKNKGVGCFFVDLTEKKAPSICKFLEENNFYLCGVLPVSTYTGGRRADHAYYSYLDKSKTIYPYLFFNYHGIGTRYKRMVSELARIAIENFNSTRTQNRIPKYGKYPPLKKPSEFFTLERG